MAGGKKDSTADRELIFTRLLDAPIAIVWKFWVSPDHIKLWWGPDGFTNTITKMDIKPGGEWHFTMHGPDGTDYPVKSVVKEIIKHKRIVLDQFGNFNCISTIEFESRGKQTFLRWQMLFESREHLIQAARTYGVDIGLPQTVERLALLAELQHS